MRGLWGCGLCLGAVDVGGCAWGVTPAPSSSPKLIHIIGEKQGFFWLPKARVNKEPSTEFPEISCQNPPLDPFRSLLPPKGALSLSLLWGSLTIKEPPGSTTTAPFPGLSPQCTFLDSLARSRTRSLWIPALVCSGAKVEPLSHHSAVQPPGSASLPPGESRGFPSHCQPPFHFTAQTNLLQLGALHWGWGEC